MLYSGNRQINRIYFGNREVGAIYYGRQKIACGTDLFRIWGPDFNPSEIHPDDHSIGPKTGVEMEWNLSSGVRTLRVSGNTSILSGDVSTDWGDGTVVPYFPGQDGHPAAHTYSRPGTYTVRLEGRFDSIKGKIVGQTSPYRQQYVDTIYSWFSRTSQNPGPRAWDDPDVKEYNPEGLTRLYIGDDVGLREIDTWAFFAAHDLSSVRFPSTLERLGNNDLYDFSYWASFLLCENLQELDLRNCVNLKNIGRSAFASCTKLQRVVLPRNLEKIFDMAFYNCAVEKIVSFAPVPPKLYKSAFEGGTVERIKVKVHPDAVLHYRNACTWSRMDVQPWGPEDFPRG